MGGDVKSTRTPMSLEVQQRFMEAANAFDGKVFPGLHGTKHENLPSIYERGLLVPGSGNGADIDVKNGSTYGVGVYIANLDAAWLSRRFASQSELLVCAVLRSAYVCQGGNDACVVQNDAHVIPMLLVRAGSIKGDRNPKLRPADHVPIEGICKIKAGGSLPQIRLFGAKAMLAAGSTWEEVADAGYSPLEVKAFAPKEINIPCEYWKARGWRPLDMWYAGYTVEALKSAGFSDHAMFSCGFSAKLLLRAGYPLQVLAEGGYSLGELAVSSSERLPCKFWKSKEYSLSDMKAAGYKAAELRGEFNAAELRGVFDIASVIRAGFLPEELADAGYTPAEFMTEGVCMSCTFWKSRGWSARKLQAAGYTVAMVKCGGFLDSEFLAAGFSEKVLLSSGYSPQDIVKAGYGLVAVVRASSERIPCAVWKNMGYALSEVKAAGYTAAQLSSQFSVTELRGHFDDSSVLAAGFLAIDLLPFFPPCALRKAGYSAGAMRKAGLPISELKGCFSPGDLKKGGYQDVDILKVGYDAGALKKAGYSPPALRRAGYTFHAMLKAGYPMSLLKSHGCTAGALEHEGCTVSDLKKMHVAPSDLKSLGYLARELQSAGFGTSRLKECGFKL